MVIPVLDELYWMRGGGAGALYNNFFQLNSAPIDYGDCSKHLEIMKGN